MKEENGEGECPWTAQCSTAVAVTEDAVTGHGHCKCPNHEGIWFHCSPCCAAMQKMYGGTHELWPPRMAIVEHLKGFPHADPLRSVYAMVRKWNALQNQDDFIAGQTLADKVSSCQVVKSIARYVRQEISVCSYMVSREVVSECWSSVVWSSVRARSCEGSFVAGDH